MVLTGLWAWTMGREMLRTNRGRGPEIKGVGGGHRRHAPQTPPDPPGGLSL